MRAFRCDGFDRPPALIDIAEPVPGTGEVLIDVAACGLNFADLLMAQGRYQDTPPLPFTMGMEVCGTVRACGPGVAQGLVGSRVAVVTGSGGLADSMTAVVARCRPVPDAMPSEVAAGFQIAYGTSHLALTRRARLRAGETLVVLGAAGGVGLTAVEIGKALGARVIAVARGADHLAAARAAGADEAVDSDAGDLKAALRGLGGADVVYDPVGGDAFTAALGAVNREGRIVVIGFASGTVPQIPANIALVKNIDIIGFYWGGYTTFAPDVLNASLTDLVAMYVAGRLSPHIGHTLPLDRAAEGLALLAERKATGKVVIVP